MFTRDDRTIQRLQNIVGRNLHKALQKDLLLCLLAERHGNDPPGDPIRKPFSAETSSVVGRC